MQLDVHSLVLSGDDLSVLRFHMCEIVAGGVGHPWGKGSLKFLGEWIRRATDEAWKKTSNIEHRMLTAMSAAIVSAT